MTTTTTSKTFNSCNGHKLTNSPCVYDSPEDNSLTFPTSSCIISKCIKVQPKSQKATLTRSINLSTCLTIVILITNALATPVLGNSAFGSSEQFCNSDDDCRVPDYVCINEQCLRPMDRGSSCSREIECRVNLICTSGSCSCAIGLKWSYIKDRCVECDFISDCREGSQLCQENQCVNKPPEGYSYLPLAFAFAILVSIVLIFSFKIITSTNERLSSSRQQLFNEDGSGGSNRRGRSARRFQRQYSSDLPDYAPPPPYSVAIASSPVIFTQPVVSTISSVVPGTNETESSTRTTTAPLTSTTSVLSPVTPASKPTEV